ncbi:hypothetical protein COO60DRAFT_752449 [Scenedesmus sp. NREL 46B-D3]|nr:hypothetical protein COO60DRAFT_752449 [Scenedesmus sp. NREL 46B-D3]
MSHCPADSASRLLTAICLLLWLLWLQLCRPTKLTGLPGLLACCPMCSKGWGGRLHRCGLHRDAARRCMLRAAQASAWAGCACCIVARKGRRARRVHAAAAAAVATQCSCPTWILLGSAEAPAAVGALVLSVGYLCLLGLGFAVWRCRCSRAGASGRQPQHMRRASCCVALRAAKLQGLGSCEAL